MSKTSADRIVCYFDGACPGNQNARKGPMKAAYVIGDREVVRDVPDLPTSQGPLRTNNIAEYHALLYLLEELVASGRESAYLICGDSELVVYQMTGRYQVRKPYLAPLHAEAKRLAARLDVTFRAVPREDNPAGRLLENEAKRARSRG